MSLSPTAGKKKVLPPSISNACVCERSSKQAASSALEPRRSLRIWNAGAVAPPLTSPSSFRRQLECTN